VNAWNPCLAQGWWTYSGMLPFVGVFVRCGCLKRQGTTVLCSALPPGFCDTLHALLCSSSWLLRYYCMLCSALLFFLASAMYCRLSLSPLGVIPASFSSHFCSAHPAMLVVLEICIACGFLWSPARFFRLSSCPSKLSCFMYVMIRLLWYITMWFVILQRLAVTEHYVQVHTVDFGGVCKPSWLGRLG